MKRPDVLVLGGGGTLGEAWLRAMLAGMEAETGWDLRECEAFVGTSAGSIVAAVLAAGRRPETARGVAEGWARAAASAEGSVPSAAKTRRGLTPALSLILAKKRRGLTRAVTVTGEKAKGSDPRAITATGEKAKGSDPIAIASVVRRAAGAAMAAAAPLAPLAAAGLEPSGAALRAAVLNRGPRATRELSQLRRMIERLGGEFDGRLRITAVDLRTGRRVAFGAPGAPAARVPDAVLASCAVPWMFRAVTIGGREYVDGGAWSAANVDVAPVRSGTEVLCLNPTASPRLAIDRLGAVRALASASAATEALLLRRRGARVRIVAPDQAAVEAIGPNLFDARRCAQVEHAGYSQGRALAASRPLRRSSR